MESKLYNPAGQPKDWLITNFVARTQVFKRIFKDLRTGKMQYPEQHYLIQGQRGMGKTTLLLRLKYEIENTPELNQWMVPVFFNEESYDLTSLSNLWEKLLKYLDSLWETGGRYYNQTDAFIGKTDYEKSCFELLIGILKKEEKKLVIFFDNFGQLFLDNLKQKEQHRFREILMACNDIRIIGASAVVLQDLHDYSKPFFEFFKIVNLEGLNKDETLELIAKLQENSDSKFDIERNKAKIETLAILTGGVIRTIMLIYEVILADEDGTALRDLETILDRITPLYKHRIEDLPVQQRKIIDVIAKGWDAISTKQIAENIREDGKPMPTKLISAQLQQLEKNNVIEKKRTNTKNHLYQLKERFFNIWYLMRNGDRFDKCRVMWLTKFLESWYSDKESIESFIKKHIELLQGGNYYPNSAIMIAEALTNSSKVNFENQAVLIQVTESILNEEQKKLLPEISLEKFEKAVLLFENQRFKDAIQLLISVEQTSLRANVLLFTCYLNLNDLQNAIKSIKADNMIKPYLLGLANLHLKDYDKSIRYFIEAQSITENDILSVGQVDNAIGFVYESGKLNYSKAIKYYKAAVEQGNYDTYDSIIRILIETEDYKSAEKYYFNAIDEGKVGFGNLLLDVIIVKLKNSERAKQLINYALKMHPNESTYLFYDALLCFFNGDIKSAEKRFLRVKKKLKKTERYLFDYKLVFTCLAGIYIDNRDKNKATKIVEEMHEFGISTEYSTNAFVYIWTNRFKEAFHNIYKYLENAKVGTNGYTESLLLVSIAKKQYHFVFHLFEIDVLNLKDEFKPIYYALMQNLKDEYPNEYLKMGIELQQPVNDVMARIEKIAIEYA